MVVANSLWSVLSICVISLLLGACTRGIHSPSSQIKIELPEHNQLQNKSLSVNQAFPVDKKACFGVNVTASDLEQTLGCHPPLSEFSGFVQGGGTLTIDVPQGEGRKFDLYVHFVDQDKTCPTWDSNFNKNPLNFLKLYLAGSTSNVNLSTEQETVSITLNFPGLQNHVAKTLAGACSRGKLRGELHSDGRLFQYGETAKSLVLSQSSTISFYERKSDSAYTNSNIAQLGASNSLNIVSDLEVSPYINSVTKKPDSNEIYGLDLSGKIYQVDLTGQAKTGFTCPFERCQLPRWIQSISAGRDKQLYALDHGGNIYEVTANGLVTTGEKVSPSVTQVSFY